MENAAQLSLCHAQHTNSSYVDKYVYVIIRQESFYYEGEIRLVLGIRAITNVSIAFRFKISLLLTSFI